VWHSQSAAWLNKNADGTLLTRAEARANMEEYIHTVAGHFAGRVIAWDVVNEAFQSNPGDAPDWRDALRVGGTTGESAPWFGAYENGADFDAGEHGADYIYDAFVFARLADPNAILYYNDFNEEYAGKREVIAKMAEDLNEKWKTDPRNTEPDRLLVEGLGLQAHYWTNFLNPKDVEDTIVRWAATGAEISITELDIPAGSYGSYKALDEDEARKQATLYAELFQIFKKHSDSIARVSIWGIDDPTSWRGEGSPLLFGENTAVKPAFFAVMDPEGYLAGEYDDLSRTDLSQWGGEASAEPDPASPDGGKETPAPAEPSTPAPTPEPEPESDGDGSWNANLYAIAAGIAGVAIIVVLVLRLRKPKGK
jgi:endo-1,4-beta-xylanase